MTLEEAIIHAEEVADRCAVTDGDRKCEEQHRQLAEWLTELVERRKQPEIIRCKDCKEFHRWIDTDIEFCDRAGNRVSENDFCSRAEKRYVENG